MSNMRELVVSAILAEVDELNLTSELWNEILDSELGIIDASESPISDDPEERKIQLTELFENTTDLDVLELFTFLLFLSGEIT